MNKKLFTVLYIIAAIFIFWGFFELLNLLPFYKNVKFDDLIGFQRLGYIVFFLIMFGLGYSIAYLLIGLGKFLIKYFYER